MAAEGKNAPDFTTEVMTADEVAELLHVHKTTIYRLVQAGKFPSFRVGSEHRFTRQAIDEWRRVQETTNPPAPSLRGKSPRNG